VGAEGHKLHAWWIKADNPDAPTVLYLHGARWNLTGSVTRVERWRKLGFNVLAIDYRGFGRSSDVVPSESLAYEDAEAAWDYLARIAPGKTRFIVGHSLGGAIATELAVRRPDASGLVLEATFTSVKDMIANTTWSFLPWSSSSRRISTC
jgi:alpha-beta hydrolase superfamily lysophospholipase